MNKWAETDAWRVRWALHGQPTKLPWSLLINIPATVLDDRAAKSAPQWFEPFRDVSNTVWVSAARWQSQQVYRVELHSPHARKVSIAARITHDAKQAIEMYGSWTAYILIYQDNRFSPIRQILQQLPEPPW